MLLIVNEKAARACPTLLSNKAVAAQAKTSFLKWILMERYSSIDGLKLSQSRSDSFPRSTLPQQSHRDHSNVSHAEYMKV